MPTLDTTYDRSRTLTDALTEAEALRYAADQVERRAAVYTGGREVTDAIAAIRDWADGRITQKQADEICKAAYNVFCDVDDRPVNDPAGAITIACFKLTDRHGEVSTTLRVEACMRAAARAAPTIGDTNTGFDADRELQIEDLEAL